VDNIKRISSAKVTALWWIAKAGMTRLLNLFVLLHTYLSRILFKKLLNVHFRIRCLAIGVDNKPQVVVYSLAPLPLAICSNLKTI
jgi:hypothetical protein